MDCKEIIFSFSKNKFDAVLFDLDGVITRTAKVHAKAWEMLFNGFLKEMAEKHAGNFKPFDPDTDYRIYVDGKPRYDGVKSFLESRKIKLPYGLPDDPPDKGTVCGLGNKKNSIFRQQLEKLGVDKYESTIDIIRRLKEEDFKIAVVSSSKNCGLILDNAGISSLFDTKVDGVDSAELGLDGKPAPDIFLEAAKRLKVEPSRSVVVEDALSGVEAGKRGEFGFVLGVARHENANELEPFSGAVVSDLEETCVERYIDDLPDAFQKYDRVFDNTGDSKVVLFFDYDGTLTPIVERPQDAILPEEMRSTLKKISQKYTTAVISGRGLKDVKSMVDIKGLIYAGSHGFEIEGPQGRNINNEKGEEFLPVMDRAEQELRKDLKSVKGINIERKKYSIAVHYRQVDDPDIDKVRKVVENTERDHDELKLSGGKKIFELAPAIDWHKGKALRWILEMLGLDKPGVVPLYIGDDLTDEHAFKSIRGCGISIVVGDGGKRTSCAEYSLSSTEAVKKFLWKMMEH